MQTVVIETPRLVLRTATLADAELVQAAKLAVWPELQRWMIWAYDDQRDLDALRAHIVRSQQAGACAFLIGLRRDNGEFAVATGLNANDERSYETGYWVAADHRQQGFATESCNAMVRYAFGALHAHEVTINFFQGNDKSARVIRRLGFPFERTRRGAHKSCIDGSPVDMHCFRRENAEDLPPLEVSWR